RHLVLLEFIAGEDYQTLDARKASERLGNKGLAERTGTAGDEDGLVVQHAEARCVRGRAGAIAWSHPNRSIGRITSMGAVLSRVSQGSCASAVGPPGSSACSSFLRCRQAKGEMLDAYGRLPIDLRETPPVSSLLFRAFMAALFRPDPHWPLQVGYKQ